MEMLNKIIQLINVNVKNIITSRKFLGIITFLMVINTIPSLITYTMAVNPPNESAKMFLRFHILNFFAQWEQLLFSQILSIIIPIFVINIALTDQIRLGRIFNLLIRPARRETVFISIIAAYLIISTLVGLITGIYIFLTMNIAYIISANSTILDPSTVIQLTVFFAITAYIYGALIAAISLTTKDYGLKTIIIYFFLTLLYDLVMTAIGGTYNYISLSIYKQSLLGNMVIDRQLKQYLTQSAPVALPQLLLSLGVIIVIGTILLLIAVFKFRKIDIV